MSVFILCLLCIGLIAYYYYQQSLKQQQLNDLAKLMQQYVRDQTLILSTRLLHYTTQTQSPTAELSYIQQRLHFLRHELRCDPRSKQDISDYAHKAELNLTLVQLKLDRLSQNVVSKPQNSPNHGAID